MSNIKLAHYDDGKQKYQSHEVYLKDTDFYHEVGVYNHNIFDAIGYGETKEEGCIYKNTYCSYFHGSLLSKNPELADRLLKVALSKKYNKDITLEKLDDTFEIKAKQSILNRFKK